MYICKKCGTELPENAKFCNLCGTPVIVTAGGDANAEAAGVPVSQPEADGQFGNGAQQETNGQPVSGVQSNTNGQFGNGAQSNTNAQPVNGAQPNTNAQFGNGPQPNGGAPFGNGLQMNGGAQFGNGPQMNGGAQFGNGPQMNGGAQFGNGPQMNGGAQFGNGPQMNGGAQFGNGPQFQQAPPKETSSVYYAKQPYLPPADDAAANKGVAVCGYIGLLWIVPLLTTAKHSPFAKFHANQALLVFLTSIVLNIAVGILNVILMTISWRMYAVTGFLTFLAGAASLALMIIGIVFAAQGKMKEIPVLGQFHLIK